MTDLRKLLSEALGWLIASKCDLDDAGDIKSVARISLLIDNIKDAFSKDAALAEPVEPIGYIDAEQLRRWNVLKGTEYESPERCYMPFSRKPWKSEMSDCSLAVYAAPADQWRRVEWIKCDDKLPMHHKDYWLCIEGGEFATIGRLNHQFNGDLYWCLENGNSSNDVPYAEVTHYAEIVRPDLPALPEDK